MRHAGGAPDLFAARALLDQLAGANQVAQLARDQPLEAAGVLGAAVDQPAQPQQRARRPALHGVINEREDVLVARGGGEQIDVGDGDGAVPGVAGELVELGAERPEVRAEQLAEALGGGRLDRRTAPGRALDQPGGNLVASRPAAIEAQRLELLHVGALDRAQRAQQRRAAERRPRIARRRGLEQHEVVAVRQRRQRVEQRLPVIGDAAPRAERDDQALDHDQARVGEERDGRHLADQRLRRQPADGQLRRVELEHSVRVEPHTQRAVGLAQAEVVRVAVGLRRSEVEMQHRVASRA